jgi:hypothetical protein
MTTKVCRRCKVEKDISEFFSNVREKDKHQIYCKPCCITQHREYSSRHREQIKAYQRKYTHGSITARLSDRFHALCRNSVKRGRKKPDFSRAEFREWVLSQPKHCFYCHSPINFMDSSATIDRLVNTQPYKLDNICVSCRRCNRVKGEYLTWNEMRAVAKFLGWMWGEDERTHLGAG